MFVIHTLFRSNLRTTDMVGRLASNQIPNSGLRWVKYCDKKTVLPPSQRNCVIMDDCLWGFFFKPVFFSSPEKIMGCVFSTHANPLHWLNINKCVFQMVLPQFTELMSLRPSTVSRCFTPQGKQRPETNSTFHLRGLKMV